jgi:hypothetical protein
MMEVNHTDADQWFLSIEDFLLVLLNTVLKH